MAIDTHSTASYTPESWGLRDVSLAETDSFASSLPLSREDRAVVADTLHRFPNACQVRGMFFDGLVNVIKTERGYDVAQSLMERTGVRGSIVPFGLLPHRDFYKLYFAAACTMHPTLSLADGLRKVAETFYPVFRASMVGRTLSALLGSDPQKILERLVDAYNMSVQDNHHSVRTIGARSMLWDCRVEPSPFFADTFAGIVRGTMRSHDVGIPQIETVSRIADGHHHSRWVFSVSW